MNEQKAISSYSKIIERSNLEYKKQVTSVVADPVSVDSHGGSMTSEVIEKASETFMEHFRNYGVGHRKDENGNVINENDKIVLLENWITRNDQTINGEFIPAGSWLQSWKINDDQIWDQVLRGELNGFSFVAFTKIKKVK